MSAIEYRGGLIARNSEAYKLWEAGDRKALDKHLATIARNAKELPERYAHLELGHIWWVADNEADFDATVPPMLAKGARLVKRWSQPGHAQIDYIIELPKFKDMEILGYHVTKEDDEWLDRSLDEQDILAMIDQRTFEVGGFASLYGSKIEHFFRNGRSLCGDFQITKSPGMTLKRKSDCPCGICIREAP